MRDSGNIIDIDKSAVWIDRVKFYDNLKLSLEYNGQDDEYGIHAHATTYFKNAIIEIFEHLKKGSYKVIFDKGDGRTFIKAEDFLEWITNVNNLSLGIEKHKSFIEKVYSDVEKNGIY